MTEIILDSAAKPAPTLAPEARLETIHTIVSESAMALKRIEARTDVSTDVLKRIEMHTGAVADFYKQLEAMARLAAGRNQVPAYLLWTVLVLIAVFALVWTVSGSNTNIKIPWAGIEITQHPPAPAAAVSVEVAK